MKPVTVIYGWQLVVTPDNPNVNGWVVVAIALAVCAVLYVGWRSSK